MFIAVVCCGGGIKAGQTKRLNKLTKKAKPPVKLELDRLEAMAERKTPDLC